MEETPTQDGTTFKWVYGQEDPGLNAAMLARLMVYLGSDRQTASDRVKQAEEQQRRPEVQIEEHKGEAYMTLNEPFDRAWRRVGLAIDSAGFSVEDSDRCTGEFFIRYLDADTGVKIEQQNIIGRLFGGRDTSVPKSCVSAYANKPDKPWFRFWMPRVRSCRQIPHDVLSKCSYSTWAKTPTNIALFY